MVRGHKSAFSRQIHEAVLIEMGAGDNILNSKGEYNRCELPRLRVEIGERPWLESGDKTEVTVQEEETEIGEDRKRDQRDSQEDQESQEPSRKRRRTLLKAARRTAPGQMERQKRARDSQADEDIQQGTPGKRKRLTN